MTMKFMVHEEVDEVGAVAVEGLKAGGNCTDWFTQGDKTVPFKLRNNTPIGHMGSSSATAEMVTLAYAAAYVAHVFPTGQSNINCNPILPVLKLSAHPHAAHTISGHCGRDVSGILRREITRDEAGAPLLPMFVCTCNGRNMSVEALGHRGFAMPRLHASAWYHVPRKTSFYVVGSLRQKAWFLACSGGFAAAPSCRLAL